MRRLEFRETERKPGSSIDEGNRRIRCPKCKWSPGRKDRWACACGHVWNTFDTRGQCPACDAKWSDTQCLRCHAWSAHEAWYADSSA